MPQPLVALALCLALAGGLSALPGPVQASEPDTQKMIEALMPSNTRSLRNLVVRQKPEAVAVAASSASAAEAATAPAASAVAAAAAPVATAPPAAAPAGPPPGLALAIQFEPNSSRVRPESGPLLGSLVAALQSPELKGNRFIIEGHADARGAAERNQRLSQERADEVRLYLVALGVHPSRLRAVGRGTSQPVNPGDPAAAENRRVRVVTVE